MSRHTCLAKAVLASLALATALAGAAHAVPGICLSRNPAPPNKVLNDGTHSITFNWTIEYGAGLTCSYPYTFEILDTNQNPIGVSQNYSCPGTNPFSNLFQWTVPQFQACGCYYGRLTYYSNWCSPETRKMEDQAITSFLVGASATFRICKYVDVNHNGVFDNDDFWEQGWEFEVSGPFGSTTVTTGEDGCATVIIEVNCTGSTNLSITDVLPAGWVKTAPQGATNPFTITVVPGPNPDVTVGNWQPIMICGNKWLDQAPWPWTDPHWSDPPNPGNPAEWEPTPTCPQPQPPPAPCVSPTQPDPTGLADVTVRLYDNSDPMDPILLETTTTGVDGSFCFGPLQWRQEFKIEMDDPAPSPPDCNPPIADIAPPIGPLGPWPGDYFGTVATSVWPCPNNDFAQPHVLEITLPVSSQVNQVYGCNYFYNWQPSRLFGKFCEEAMELLPSISLGLKKDGYTYPTPSVSPQTDGSYIVPEISVEPEGLRQGTYRLTPPLLPDPTTQSWVVTTYCDSIHGNSTFPLPVSGYVDVGVPHSSDVRVDFCIIVNPPNERRCYLPVTFTQQGWHDFCDPNSPIVPGGMVYNRFPIVFANFTYYSTLYHSKMIIGLNKTMTWEATTLGLSRLCAFFPQTGACGKLDTSYVNAWSLPVGVGGELAGELAALQMNIAYNDRRQMPRTPGYDLEKFTLTASILRGKTVQYVRNIANAVLGGAPPCNYGLANCQELTDILAAINANYEFVNFDTFVDRGFLQPDAGSLPFGPSKPATPVVVP